jgi:hypothetical protein
MPAALHTLAALGQVAGGSIVILYIAGGLRERRHKAKTVVSPYFSGAADSAKERRVDKVVSDAWRIWLYPPVRPVEAVRSG